MADLADIVATLDRSGGRHRRHVFANPDRLWWVPVAGALSLLCGLLAVSLVGLAGHATLGALGAIVSDPYIHRVAGFTVLQAGLSALISVALAIPFARTAARRPDWRIVRVLLALGNLAFVTPVVVGVFGVVQVHGGSGWINAVIAWLGGEPVRYLYGLSGILIAHAFFNMPFAARIFAGAIAATPSESWRLAGQLGMGPLALFRLIEWPALRAVLFPTMAVIFALCFTSFAVVLTLGGGPGATILEVAIYQSLRFDFDIDRAVALAMVQVVLAGSIALLISSGARNLPTEPASGIASWRTDARGMMAAASDGAMVVIAILVVALPLAGAVLPGLAGLTGSRLADPVLWRAAGTSLILALAAGSLSLALALGLSLGVREFRHRRAWPAGAAGLEGAGAIILVTPPLLLGAGLFLFLRGHTDVFAAAPFLIPLVNAVAALPLVMRIVGPDLARTAPLHDRLASSLGVAGWARWRLVDWPVVRPAAGTALGVAAAMAAGDLGVIALFGTPDFTTLPLLVYQRMGAYRTDEAAIGAIVLMGLALLLLVGLERGLKGRGTDA